MNEEKVNSFSICMLIFGLTKASFFGVGFEYVYKNSHTSSLLSVITGITLGIFISLIFINLIKEKSIILRIKDNFPKVISFIINLILSLCALFYAAMALWRIIDFLASQYLTNTPTILTSVLVIGIIFYTLIRNKEVLTRFATIVFFISLFLFILNMISLIPYIDLDNLKPFKITLNGYIKSSLYFALLFSGPLFFLTIFNKNNITDIDKFKKRYLIFYGLSSITIMIIFFLVITCFGDEIISIYSYPVYMVLKKISLVSFIESIENFSSIIWYIFLHILILCSLFYIKETILEYTNIKKSKRNIMIISFILCLITLLLPIFVLEKNYNLAENIYIIFPVITNLTMILTSLFLLIYFKIKNKA